MVSDSLVAPVTGIPVVVRSEKSELSEEPCSGTAAFGGRLPDSTSWVVAAAAMLSTGTICSPWLLITTMPVPRSTSLRGVPESKPKLPTRE